MKQTCVQKTMLVLFKKMYILKIYLRDNNTKYGYEI